MSENTLRYQSNKSLYIRIWLVSSVAIIVLRFLGMTQDQRANVLMFYMAISWFMLMIVSLFESQRFAQYLNKHRPELVKRSRYSFGLSAFDGRCLLEVSDKINPQAGICGEQF